MAQVANVEKVEKVARKTITVRVPMKIHQKLKAITKFSNVSMQAVLADFISSYVESNFNVEIHMIDEADNSD